MATSKREKMKRRKLHIRKTIHGTAERPRLSVFRSNRYLFAQAVDDESNTVIAALWEKKLASRKGEKPLDRAKRQGEVFGKLLKKKKVSTVVFDRGGFKYHGRVRSFAEGVRSQEINF